MKKSHRVKSNKGILFTIAAVIYILMLIFHQAAKEGAISAFKNCAYNVLPSVFPALLLTSFMTDTGMPAPLHKTAGKIFSVIFGTSSDCAEIILYGLIAGYPAGMKTAVKCSKNKVSTHKNIRKAALTATNPGIAFTVLSLGKQTGSAKVGLYLYISVTAAQIISAQFIRKKDDTTEIGSYDIRNRVDPSVLLNNAVSGAANACISMTAWITAFGAFSQLTSLIPLRIFSSVLLPVSEVTHATSDLLHIQNYPLAAFSLGFGGICVFFQLLPDILELGISPFRFLIFRFVCGTFSAAVMKCLARFIPAAITVSTWPADTALHVRSNGCVLSLFFFCVIFMFGLANKLPIW